MINLLLALATVVALKTPPKPVLVCYIRDVNTGECVVWYDRSSGKFYDKFGNVIPNPLP
jgi:hypothetical protein